MSSDILLQEVIDHFNKISNYDSIGMLKNDCNNFFDTFSLTGSNDEIAAFARQVIKNIHLTGSEISKKFSEESRIMMAIQNQVGFYLCFYSFIVSKYSFQIDQDAIEEISTLLVDLLSNLTICIGNTNLKIFMSNFVLSFHPFLSSLLLDIYESLGLDIPPEIAPKDYYADDDNATVIIAPIVVEKPIKRRKSKRFHLEENLHLIEGKSSSLYRPELSLDLPFNRDDPSSTLTTVLTTVSRSKSTITRSKKTPKVTPKKARKRRSLAPDTPNVKADNYVSRPHRAAAAARHKLNGGERVYLASPIADRRQPATPTTLRMLRKANSATAKMFAEPTTAAGLWVKRQQDEERSLTTFSQTEACSLPSFEASSGRRVTRFRSRLLDLFMSPCKEVPNNVRASPNDKGHSKEVSSHRQDPKEASSHRQDPKEASSHRQDPKEALNHRQDPKEASSHSQDPKEASQGTRRSPSHRRASIAATTGLRSCLRSPIHKRTAATQEDVSTTPKRPRTDSGRPPSVLLSPRVAQRTFVASRPPQYFCEDTMFMDTGEFISRSTPQGSQAASVPLRTSPRTAPPPEDSQHSFETVPASSRPKAASLRRSRVSIERRLFESGPSGSSVPNGNVLRASSLRRSLAPPCLALLEPDTDDSNGALRI